MMTNNKFISVSYKLHIDNDGQRELKEQTPEGKPLQFYTGLNLVLPAFEQKLSEMKAGEQREITLTSSEAYGEYEADRVVELDKAIFMPNGELDSTRVYEGAVIPLQNEQGQTFLGQILEVGDENVKVDLNHPLAGKDLYFEVSVLENREADSEEVDEYVRLRSQHHCGGGCGGGHCGEGGCGGNCGGGGCGGHDDGHECCDGCH